ncbi:Protein FAM200B [Dissostichus eleginoides]|uniref:Protein FAM200B n=1 Tax=Dissostichus eleginoides TaxID=100907 RepID=A0AAD9CB88_DISEL|nr:Protein FAM200B [Dissostichus eleginoides]
MKMRENPFTLVTDGSNDTGLEKMNPLTVRIFDINKVVHLDMCTTSGRRFDTAEVIYTKINDTLQENDIPWRNCVGLSIDNAPVNTGARNSISARMLKENGSIYIHGSPCHIIHNTAKHAGQKFMEISGFDPEDLTVDVGYWFKGSTNRKGYLAEFCEFHESEYMEMLLHISMRWLSLERCITRILRQYGPLTSYFKSLNDKVHQELCARFMKPSALQGRQVHDIFYKDPLNQLPGEKRNVGFTTRATLNRLLEAGDITPQEVQLFQQAALAFLVRAVEYGINKLPLKEALLRHTRFVDVQQRTECGVEDALYFIDRFQELLPFHGPEEQDKVCEEFLEYQLMDIPMPQDPTTFNVEEFWGSMSSIKCKVTDKTTVPTQSPAAAKISL